MIYCIIAARMNSQRLPGKVLMDLRGKPVIVRIVERLKRCKLIDKIIIATRDEEANNEIESVCKSEGIEFFKHKETNDVLERYVKCGEKYRIKPDDGVVRITGDCPLIDPEIVDICIEKFIAGNYDYVSNVCPPTFPDGLDTEVFEFWTLQDAHEKTNNTYHRQHIDEYILDNLRNYKHFNIENYTDTKAHRWTMDTKEDYAFIKDVYQELYKEGEVFLMHDILNYLERK